MNEPGLVPVLLRLRPQIDYVFDTSLSESFKLSLGGLAGGEHCRFRIGQVSYRELVYGDQISSAGFILR